MNYWFIAMVAIYILNLGINLGRHGQPKKNEKYSFWSALIGSGIGFVIVYMAVKTGF